MNSKIRLLVVDDHNLFRRGLVALLSQHGDLEVVGEAGDAGVAQRRAAETQPDVILLDNHLPGARGVDAIPALRSAAPASRVLMLTVSEDDADLAAALRNGASGYLLKTAEDDELREAIAGCMRGESVLSPAMTARLVHAFRQPAAPAAAANELDALSPRETEVLRELARGESNKEIARTLAIAEPTVKIHVQGILRKLNLRSRVQAAVYASERGLAARAA
ncbi:MAG TPA: response regulator transcription factor [Burkholderiaceae bacterium]